MARMSTGKKVLIGGVVVAAVGGIGYFIWKKMKAAEEEQEASFQAQSSTMSGMGAYRSCPSGSHMIGINDRRPPCCIGDDVLREIDVPAGTKCPHGYATFLGGTYGGITICNATAKYLRSHCIG